MTHADTLRHFLKDETGAVTVDWVVLTAAIVALAAAAAYVAMPGASELAGNISETTGSLQVGFDRITGGGETPDTPPN